MGTGSQLARPQLGETLARPHDTQPGDTSPTEEASQQSAPQDRYIITAVGINHNTAAEIKMLP